MTHRSYPQIFTVIIFVSIFLFLQIPAFAHRMLIRPIEPGLIQVVFDDDTVAKGAQVTLYDEGEEQLVQGNSDGEGFFKYDSKLPVALAVADDRIGHRATWQPDQEIKEELPKLPVAVLTLSVFIFVAAFFHLRNTKGRTCS
ncbi:MAG: response regulator [Dethiobacter sp.]|jgi:hypothetical protein|nr:response regulator [Dethiobacter sp.]